MVVGTGNKVEFVEKQLRVINPTTILAVGFNDFMRNREGKLVPEPARFTMVFVKESNDWVIAHHHSSSRPPPKQLSSALGTSADLPCECSLVGLGGRWRAECQTDPSGQNISEHVSILPWL